MNAISFKKWVSTILLLAITISLCGCSTNRTAASQDEHLTTTTAFIVLNGANVPALNSSAIASFVDTPQDGDRSILIVPDGNPSITTFSFDSTAKNVTYATAESKKWYKEICTSIIDARPDDADTDLLSAILLAANELKASDTQARHLMLLCNGLNTAPMLNFAETPFWSDATSIDEIISQLLKLNYLSADLLEDVDVTWASSHCLWLTDAGGLTSSNRMLTIFPPLTPTEIASSSKQTPFSRVEYCDKQATTEPLFSIPFAIRSRQSLPKQIRRSSNHGSWPRSFSAW